MSNFYFSAKELRDIILNKTIIKKCPDCGCYSQFNRNGQIPDDGEGNIVPYNKVEEYMDTYDWIGWSECETCDGLGYLISFIK